MPIEAKLLLYFALFLFVFFIKRASIQKRATISKKEVIGEQESRNIGDVDFMTDVLVTFKYLHNNSQFMMMAPPIITINGTDKYRLTSDKLTLKLPGAFTMKFCIPYMNREAFKVSDTYRLVNGYKYTIIFKARFFVFQKAKVEVIKEGLIEAI